MDVNDPRDLDSVIDDVARAMTSDAPARDLRPAVAARLATSSSWTFGWRTGFAAAAVAAVVLAAVVMRPGMPDVKSNRPPSSAVADGSGPATGAPTGQSVEAASTASLAAVARPQPARAVARQTIDDGPDTDDVVEVTPLAIAPLEDSDATDITLMSQSVEIAPIDIEPLTIGELEQVE